MEPTEGMSGGNSVDARGRRRAAGALSGVAVLLAVLALVLSYLGRAVLRPGPFADRAVATLRDPAVQADVADRLTEAVTRSGGGDLVAVRPLVRSVAGAIVGGNAFAALFRHALLEAHGAVVQHNGGRFLVTVADLGVLVQGVLERFAPGAGRSIAADRVSTLLSVRLGSGVLDLVRVAKNVYAAAWVLAVLALLAAGGAALISPDRRRTVWQCGIGLLAAGLAVVVLLTVGREIADQVAPSGRGAAVGAAWTAFLGGLRVQALLLAVAGAICAGAASGQLPRVGAEARLATGWMLAPHTEARSPHLAGALALIAAGVVTLLEPAAALGVAVPSVGLYVLYKGVTGALGAVATAGRRRSSANPEPLRRLGRLAPAAVAVVVVACLLAIIAAGGGDQARAHTPVACNGSTALCDRPLNQVALAATHNSMASVTIQHWLFGQQDGTIAEQLRYGIHGLLIDTYYGFAEGRSVRTDLKSLPKRKVAEQEIGAPAVEAAYGSGHAWGPVRQARWESFCATASVSSAR